MGDHVVVKGMELLDLDWGALTMHLMQPGWSCNHYLLHHLSFMHIHVHVYCKLTVYMCTCLCPHHRLLLPLFFRPIFDASDDLQINSTHKTGDTFSVTSELEELCWSVDLNIPVSHSRSVCFGWS